jgi:hypothetical protein
MHQARAVSAASGGRFLTLERVACSSDIPSAVRTGGKPQQNKRSATLTTADNLLPRLRAVLSDKRAKRARIGRAPADYRRPAFRPRHAALDHEIFKPTVAPNSETGSGIEKLAQSHVEVLPVPDLLAKVKAMSASELAAIPRLVDGEIKDNACTTERIEGERMRRTRG